MSNLYVQFLWDIELLSGWFIILIILIYKPIYERVTFRQKDWTGRKERNQEGVEHGIWHPQPFLFIQMRSKYYIVLVSTPSFPLGFLIFLNYAPHPIVRHTISGW